MSLAIASIGQLAKRLGDDMSRTRVLAVLTDSEQLEAELTAVRAEAQAEVSSAAQLQTAARRERLEADEAAEAALAAATQAREAEQAARKRARDAEAIAEDAEPRYASPFPERTTTMPLRAEIATSLDVERGELVKPERRVMQQCHDRPVPADAPARPPAAARAAPPSTAPAALLAPTARA